MRASTTLFRTQFSRRSPPRLSRWRTVLPEDAGIGQVRATWARAASLRTRPGGPPAQDDGGGDGPDTGHGEQFGCAFGDDRGELVPVGLQVDVELDDTSGQPEGLCSCG